MDHVSKSIVFLAGRPEFYGRIAHLTNPEALSLRQLAAWLNDHGYPVRSLPVAEWADCAVREIAAAPHHVLYPLLPLIEDWRASAEETAAGANPYDCRTTLAMLAQGRIGRPLRADELFSAYLSYFAACGFIGAPRSAIQPPPANPMEDVCYE